MESTLAHLSVCLVLAGLMALVFYKTTSHPGNFSSWLAVSALGAILSFWLAGSAGFLTRSDYSTNEWMAGITMVAGSLFCCGLRWMRIRRQMRQ